MEGEGGTKHGKQKKTQKVIIFYSINCEFTTFCVASCSDDAILGSF